MKIDEKSTPEYQQAKREYEEDLVVAEKNGITPDEAWAKRAAADKESR